MDEEYRKYPVLQGFTRTNTPEYVPWDMLSPYENRAYKNHGQSLERLAQRGGLGWGEILAILEDRPWSSISRDEAQNKEAVLRYVSEYFAHRRTAEMDKDVLEVARGELGNAESPAGSNRTKYGAWMKLDGQPWCMSFVQWCYAQAGHPLPFRTGSCSALLNWYRANQPECVVTSPHPRDIIIYNFGHTGIVESVSGGKITAIEGNTSAGDSGSQDNGGGVFRRTRKKSLVKAYIRPIQKEDDMEQEKFNQMFKTAMEAYRKELRDNDCGQWSREAREYAVSSGLFAGSGTTPDGQPNYMWEDLLTREQVAQLFYRFAQRNGLV